MEHTACSFVGPFFYIGGGFIAHKIPLCEGQKRGDKLDNSYSHEKLYDAHYKSGDYINIPRGRIVWDIEQAKGIIYIDVCIEQVDDAVRKIAELFHLTDYIVEHDEHYVCPACMKNIWEDG